MQERRFQVVVIGGGHAGVEAAWAAANVLGGRSLGSSPLRDERLHSKSVSSVEHTDAPEGRGTVALITLDPSKIGVMSCNPAIGGLAKGQLVREIDALGGLMGLATDATGIQFKVLNTSKGPAVHGPRAQCDKHAYAEAVQRMIASRIAVEVIAGSVEELIVEREGTGQEIRGVLIACNGERVRVHARSVVLTTGTFMRGLMHTGETRTPGGRFGEAPAVGISGALSALGFELGRLKTGTPPRLRRGTIDWENLEPQWGDATPIAFSELSGARHRASDIGHREEISSARSYDFHECRIPNAESQFPSLARFPVLPQVECRQTHTSPATHNLIRANLHRAPMYSGQIESVGPRYCPSIEDKVVRFAQREQHGVFLEPESLRTDWIYCNGISTSLPMDVQDVIVRSMPGCERAEILRYGYAVEYDMVRPHQILASGQTKLVEGLFLAGQINGTSGYEEAAAQGLVAGLNAARRVRGEEEFVFGREQAYIGVLMDDLVTKTPVEPYRMFTSRAEHRLLLRSDNAADRLTPLADELGLLADDGLGAGFGAMRRELFKDRKAALSRVDALVDTIMLDGEPLEKLLRGQGFEFEKFRGVMHTHGAVAGDGVLRTVHAQRRYAAYITRQEHEIRRSAEIEHKKLPERIDYAALTNLRNEARHALAKFRPRTFGQASRLEGITPSDVTLLAVLVRQWHGNAHSES